MRKLGIDQYIFYLAVFLLPTTGYISGFLFLISIVLSFRLYRKEIFSENWNYPLIIAIFFMLLSSLSHKHLINSEWSSSLSWLGLTNWIPLFFCFWGFQPHLKSIEKRKYTVYALISGTIPVLISGIGQYWFNWTGPFQLLGGLIIWYQRPLDTDSLFGITALFNNQNYLGIWLIICLPISIALIFDKSKNLLQRTFSFIISLMMASGVVLTGSRNAILALFLIIPLLFINSINLSSLISIFFFLLFIIFLFLLSFLSLDFKLIFESILSSEFFTNLNFTRYGQDNRFSIWRHTIDLALQKPLFGWGPDIFSDLHNSKIEDIQHAHNLYLDLAFNYGLPCVFIIFGIIFLLLIKVLLNNLNLSKTKVSIKFASFIEKSWWVSCLIFSLTQLFDVQYYDGRISITFWLLLAGLKAQLNENKFIIK